MTDTPNHKWTITADQEIECEALDVDAHTDYCFARQWGCGHEEAIKVASDATHKLRENLMERLFG